MTGYTTLVRLPVINRAPGSGIPRYKEKRPPTRINVREGANPKFIYFVTVLRHLYLFVSF